jgi:hypothetical protein
VTKQKLRYLLNVFFLRKAKKEELDSVLAAARFNSKAEKHISNPTA